MGYTNQFGLDVGVNLNTQNVPTQLQSLNAQLQRSSASKIQIPVVVNTKTGLTALKDFIKEVNTYKDKLGNTFREVKIIDPKTGEIWKDKDKITQVSSAIQTLTTETHKWTNTKGEINTWTTSVDNAGKTLQTRTKQYVNDTNELVTETSQWGRNAKGQWEQLGNTVQKTSEIVKESTTSTSTVKGTIDDLGKSYQGLITTTEKVSSNGEYLKTVISKYTNEMGQAVEKTEQFDKTGKQVATTMRKIGDVAKTVDTKKATFIDKDGNQTVTQYVNGIATLRTEIKKYTDDVGNLIVLTQKYDAATNQLISSDEQLTRNIQAEVAEDKKKEQELDNIITKIIEQRNEQERLNKALVSSTTTHTKGMSTLWGDSSGKEYQSLITTIKSVDAEGRKTIKTIEEFTDAEGRLVQQTRTTDAQLNKIAEDEQIITDASKRAGNGIKGLGESAEKANYGVKNLGWTLSDAFSRLANFYLASLPLRALQSGISNTIETIKDFDSALIEFRKVSDLAGESLTNYVSKLAEMGEITGSTMQAMVEASTEFRKSGFSDEDSAKLASIAEMYRNIADEEISAAESASFIIAQMKAFNIEADQAEHIIDSVNEVANRFSVSSADLAKNLGNMSAIMAINNVSMEQQIGMLTGVTEITRNASSASRGLVMISSRLTQVLDDTSSTGKKLTAIYDDLDIKLKDENGQLRSHYDILSDLATKWDSLSENQQKYIALTSAGARQQQNFVSLMENWGQVAKATATAYNSLGSAQRENEKVMDSVAKKVEILKSQFQQLVIGKGGLQDFAKILLNIGIALLKFANSDVGKTLIQVTAFETALVLVSKGLKTLKTDLIEHAVALVTDTMATKGRTAAEIEAKVAEIGLTKAIQYSTAALIDNAIAFASTPFGLVTILLGAIAAITIANARAMEKYNKRLETASEKLNELADSAKDAESELDRLKSSLESIQDQIKRNNENKLKINDEKALKELDEANEKLKQQEESLKRQIVLQERKLELAQKEAEEQARTTLNTTTSSQFKKTEIVDSFSGAGTGEFVGVEVTPERELQLAIDRYKELKEEAKELQAQLDATNPHTEEWDELNSKLSDTQSEMDDVENRGLEMSEIITDAADNLTSTNDKTVEYKEALYGLVDALYETTGAEREVGEEQEKTLEEYEKEAEEAEELAKEIEDLAESLGITATELEGLRERFDDLTLDSFLSQLADVRQEISDTNTVIDNLQSALETASTALEEYNENGYLTLDTFQSLMSVSAQYLAALVNEEGQLEINQTTLGNLVEQLKIAKIEELQEAAAMEIAANHTDDASSASANAVGNVSKIGSTIEETGNKAATAAGKVATFAISVQKLSGVSSGDLTAKDKSTIKYYENLAKEIANIKVNTTRAGNAATKAGKKGASAAKSAKDATKDLNKELEETKKKYDTVIKWISKQYDKKTDALKNAKEEATDAIEKEIKALEKEKDSIIDGLKDKKDALEKEKDTILDGIEVEIKALEDSKDARKKYWDEQIDALKKANDARKDAIELQEKLDALERARNTKVKIYKEGQGFVFDVDQTKVAEAQKALDEYLSEKAYEDELARLEALKDAELDNFEKRIDALNDYKDKRQKALEDEIDALDDYIDELEKHYEEEIDILNERKDAVEEQYDAEIKMYENYKQQFEDMVNAYEEQQNKLLAQQLTGINFENDNWMTRLDNLANFVNEYNRLQAQLDTGTTSASNNASMSGGGGLPSGGSPSSSTKNVNASSGGGSQGQGVIGSRDASKSTYNSASLTQARNRQRAKTASKYDSSIKYIGYASGASSIKDDEIAIVGENPNQEIVVGSKLNNGELMSLNKGAGVVNAESSSTLAGMLNQVGKFGSSGFGSGNGTLNNNINNDSLTINGVTIQGADINDPQTFVNGLLNLKAEALQRAYKHR